MKKFVILFISLLLVFHVLAQNNHVAGEVIIKIESDELENFLQTINSDFPILSISLKETISKDANLYLFQYNVANQSIQEEEILPLFSNYSSCKLAQWNHNNLKSRAVPNDPSFKVQWNLKNVEAEKAWAISTGGMTRDSQEIVVAVVDESCAINHDDLKDNLWKNKHEIPKNGIDDDGNGYIDDYDGWNVLEDTGLIYGIPKSHGSMVTGMLGAKSNNGIDIASVNWKVKIMPIMGSSTIESVVLKSYDYVLKMRKLYNRSNGDSGAFVVVVNSSFGVNKGAPADFPAWCEMYNTLGKAGIVSVGAGPNSRTDVDIVGDIPTTCPSNYLIAVTNINRNDNLGNAGYGKINMDIGAPGTDVISTNSSNSVQPGTGTSFASPMVAGAIALMYSALPIDTLAKYKNDGDKLALLVRKLLLTKGCRKIADLKGITASNGTLNLYWAMLAAIDSTDTTVNVQSISNSPYSLSVYPNPFSKEISVELLNAENLNWDIEIVNVNGTIMYSNRMKNEWETTVDLGNFSRGMYLLKVRIEGYDIVTKRLIKN